MSLKLVYVALAREQFTLPLANIVFLGMSRVERSGLAIDVPLLVVPFQRFAFTGL